MRLITNITEAMKEGNWFEQEGDYRGYAREAAKIGNCA